MAQAKKPKKKKRGLIKGVYRTFFDVPSWLGLKNLRDSNRTIVDATKSLFKVKKPERKETFEQAIQRLGLTTADITERIKGFNTAAYVFALAGVLLLLYAFYLVWSAVFSGALLAIVVAGFALSRAFYYSFWVFQMKNKKLGCTIKEWYSGKVDP